jgi:hypothetical protein
MSFERTVLIVAAKPVSMPVDNPVLTDIPELKLPGFAIKNIK